MSPNDIDDVTGALDQLVNQFSDPLSFLRELIQNAIDAGSLQIEVRFEHQAEADGGTLIIHVEDWGEGMDREIINTRLTRLFSSSKDQDLTKIGRFGIGFASVFALEPDAVCVDTGRAGQWWRLLFRRDRSFRLQPLEDPIEGTHIQVIKSADADEAEALRRRAREVVRYWCKHVEVELFFDGDLVSGPLSLEAPVIAWHHEQGTDVVAGYTKDGSEFRGFYNKGLTLLEEQTSEFPGVAFKVSSRYLEHTLTRDSVLRDQNYDKAIAIVERLVKFDLLEALFGGLERALAQDEPVTEDRLIELRGLAASWLRRTRPRGWPPEILDSAVLQGVDGRPLTIDDVSKAAAKDRLLLAPCASPLTEALEAEGYLLCSPEGGQGEILAALGVESWAGAHWCRPVLIPEEQRGPGWRRLRPALTGLLAAGQFKVKSVELGQLADPGSIAKDWPAVSQRRPGELTALSDARQLGGSLLSRRRSLVINAEQATVRLLLDQAESEPELAAYTLAKLFFLGAELDAELDATLLNEATEQRCRRLKI